MEREEMRGEMEAMMKQLSPGRQRQLLELARALRRVENRLDEPPASDGEVAP